MRPKAHCFFWTPLAAWLAAPLAHAGCLAVDPAPEGIETRAAPDGPALGALTNGQWVSIGRSAADAQKRLWLRVADEATGEDYGWVREKSILCYDTSRSPPFRAPAPLGVFGVDMPDAGRTTLSLIPFVTRFKTSRIGASIVSADYIVTHVPWFSTSQKLRLVPTQVNFAAETVNVAYGLTSDLAVVVNAGLAQKRVDMLTFAGASGARPLGDSSSGVQGLTDAQAALVARVYDDRVNRVQLNFGLGLPTGANNATLTLLNPAGVYATARAFYGMQPGTGTVDVLPGAVYAGTLGAWSWGASYRARLPLARNGDNYRYGNLQEANLWGGYSWISGVTATLRLAGLAQGPIQGMDPQILGKAQGANPAFYGGQRAEIFGGLTLNGRLIGQDQAALQIEVGAPCWQNLNGPQLSKAWQAGLALRFKF